MRIGMARAVVALAVGVAAVLALPSVACAWSFSSNVGSNLFLTRESSDTATATVLVFRYGGTPTAWQWANSAYDETNSVNAFFYPVRYSASATVVVDPMCRHISYAAIPSYSHLLYIMETGQKWFVGPGNSQAVYLAYPNSSAATGAIQTSIIGTVAANIASIAAETTMSVAGTLPVDPWVSSTRNAAVTGIVLAGAAIGFMLSGRPIGGRA